MTTGNTTLLGLALPVEGELDGTWGDVVNDSITALLDSAVAGTTTLSADSEVTLTTTALAANQARQAVLLWTASNGATTRNITAPAQSKPYIVINAGTGSIVLRGAGPTTGITLVAGERCVAAWSGADFVKIASTAPGNAAGSNTQVQFNSSGNLAGSSNLTFDGAALSVDGVVITRGANSIDTNVGVGASLGANTSGYDNTAVGNNSLNANTTGAQNTSVGSGALRLNTTAGANTALGALALETNTTGGSNTAVGLGALNANTTGAVNVAVGFSALASSNGGNNTALGGQALLNVTTGNGNIGIGRSAGSAITTGSNNTIIGPFVGSGSLSGVVAISADGTNRIYVDASGNVGFNTSSPTANIDHTGSTLRLRTSRTPASASATGNAGDICWDSNYVYVCVATNTWKRSLLSTW